MFHQVSFPVLLLLTLPGDISEIRQSLSVTVRPVIMQLVRKWQLSRRSSRTPPPHLRPAILQAVLEDTYIDDWGVGAVSPSNLSTLQQEIERILNRGGFFIKSWEKSGENGTSKYLGMTWDRLKDLYSLKFRLNLHKKSCGIPSGEDLDSDFWQDKSIPVTKKNVLSVACNFYDPTGLAAPLMFYVQALFSEICREPQCSINSILSEERTAKFRDAVREILLTREIFFPRQVIF